jgi:hypothetical protein
VKRGELIRKISREAKRQGVPWVPDAGGSHDTFWLGSIKIPIPRHTEIGEGLAQKILHECETKLGKGWWRK